MSNYEDPKMFKDETAQAIVMLANAVNEVATQLSALGLNGADTRMGAIEALCVNVKEGFKYLGDSVESLGDAIQEGR